MKRPAAAGVFLSDTSRPAEVVVRRGLNVIELWLIFCGVALLIALLAPAVMRVRAAATRMGCANNLKQLGLACHNSHDVSNHFPPGTMPNPALPPEQRLSFQIVIVPYVESDNLYSSLALKEAWDSERNISVMAQRTYKRYQCPSWLGPKGPDASFAATGHLAITNYIGVAGVGADAAARPADAPGNGIFGYDRTVKKEDVKDGLENTLLLIETGREVGPWIRGGPSTVRGVDVDDAPLAGTDRPFGGTHPKGFNVLLADASVRFTSNDISPAILAALATIAGGEDIPANW